MGRFALLPAVRRAATRSFCAFPTIEPQFVLQYDYCENVLQKREPHRAGHLALATQFAREGSLVMGGAFESPKDGAMIVFNEKAAAYRFAKADPYVKEGIVTKHRIREYSSVNFWDADGFAL